MSKEPVLVLLHSDGWVEVFGDKEKLSVHIAQMPAMESPAGEILAEEFIEESLPNVYRDIFWPGNKLEVNQCRKITPQDIYDTMLTLDTLSALTEVRRGTDGGHGEGRRTLRRKPSATDT